MYFRVSRKKHPWGILSRRIAEGVIPIGQEEGGEIVDKSFVEETNQRRKMTIFEFS